MYIDIALYVAYVLVLIGILGTLILPLIQAIGRPKSLIKLGLGVVVLAIIYGIGWALSSSEVTEAYRTFGMNEMTSRMVGAALIMMYVLLGALIIGLIYSEIAKIIK